MDNGSVKAKADGKVSEYDLMRLHRALVLNLDKIESTSLSILPSDLSTEATSKIVATRKSTFQSLSTLLAKLGPAPDTSRLRLALISKERNMLRTSSLAVSTTQILQDFLHKVENRPGRENALHVMNERRFFFEGGLSKVYDFAFNLFCFFFLIYHL